MGNRLNWHLAIEKNEFRKKNVNIYIYIKERNEKKEFAIRKYKVTLENLFCIFFNAVQSLFRVMYLLYALMLKKAFSATVSENSKILFTTFRDLISITTVNGKLSGKVCKIKFSLRLNQWMILLHKHFKRLVKRKILVA